MTRKGTKEYRYCVIVGVGLGAGAGVGATQNPIAARSIAGNSERFFVSINRNAIF